MFHTLTVSRELRADRPLVPSGVVSLLAHAGVVAAVLLGTLRPHRVAGAAGAPVVISWPQTPKEPSNSLDPEPGPIGPVVDVPPQPPIGLPPIDRGLRFDTGSLLGTGHDTVGSRDDAAGSPWSIGAVEDPPVLLAGPPLAYPEALRRAAISGRVVVQAVIDTLGRAEPGSITVESSAAGLEAAARTYVLGALFRPARVHGRPVRVLVRLPIDFTLAPPR